jgi:beta-glucosidase
MSVEALLNQLTLEEKAALTSGSEFWYTAGVDRLGIRRASA